MTLRKLFTAVALLAGATAAQAAPIFSDNFDADALGLNTTSFVQGWTVSNGTVDTIGTPGFFDFIPGNGHYIDLDGSSGLAGTFSNSVVLSAGTTYVMTFSLAGNHRGYDPDVVDVMFGSSTATYVMYSPDPLAPHTLSFTAGVSGPVTFSFHNHGGDDVGALLDNVSIAAVPEPETYAMLLAGLGALGFAARRRRIG
jgi:hypothetical protein